MRITYLKTGKEWIYKSFTLYLVLIIFISVILSILGFFFNDSYNYLEIIGFIGVSIEAAVPIPQAYRNYKNKSVKGFSKMVLIVWFTGDICKVCYHGFMHTPHQFFLCGLFQLFMDIVITSQWLYYSGSSFDWYDCYSRKYGLYYVNDDEDDGNYTDYSYDSNSYQKCNTTSFSSSGDSYSSSSICSSNSSPTPTIKLSPHDSNGNYTYLKNKEDESIQFSEDNKGTEDNYSLTSNVLSDLISLSSKKNENLLIPEGSVYRKNSQSSISTFFSSADEAAGNDGDIEKESDGEELELFAVPKNPFLSLPSSETKISHHIHSSTRINNENIPIIFEEKDLEDFTNQLALSEVDSFKKDYNIGNHIGNYSSSVSDIGSCSAVTPTSFNFSVDSSASPTLPSHNTPDKVKHHHKHHHRKRHNLDQNMGNKTQRQRQPSKSDSQQQSHHHHHHHHHHDSSTLSLKSKRNSISNTKKSKENYGIDKSIFEYLQDGYGKLNPRLNEISFNNNKISSVTTITTTKSTSVTSTLKSSNNNGKNNSNTIESNSNNRNNEINIPIADINNNDDIPTSPSKKRISNIVKKTFENIVGRKKGFVYNHLEDINNNDIELKPYNSSLQTNEQTKLPLDSDTHNIKNTNDITITITSSSVTGETTSNDNNNNNNKSLNNSDNTINSKINDNSDKKYDNENNINNNENNSNNNNNDNNNINNTNHNDNKTITNKNRNNKNYNNITINTQLKENLNMTKLPIDIKSATVISTSSSLTYQNEHNIKPSSAIEGKTFIHQLLLPINEPVANTSSPTTSKIKSSTISTIISHTKPIGVATSKLISTSSAAINNRLQSTKRAKAKANAEAAFQAEIDVAFDGDDFDRDIRDGIGFSSIKNKSYNRKKDPESNSNVSGYSSTTSVDSTTDGQGHHFTKKWKNWTGFTINEVDYSEGEQKTSMKERQDDSIKKEGNVKY